LLAGLTPGVIRISLTQLAREAVCFLGFASLPICQGGFVECARSYGRIIVKQGHSLKRFAGVIEISVLELNFACKADGKSVTRRGPRQRL